jgi:phosphoesterase RecJ-like protein
MPLDWFPFVNLVHRHQRFLLTTHVRPDGDGLGSMIALADTLESLGKQARLVVASSLPPRYAFLAPAGRIERFNAADASHRAADVALVLDTGTWNQLGDFGPFLRELNVPKLVIDHHLTQDDLGAERLVDTSAEATGRLIFEAIAALGLQPSPAAARALFVALAMDTGWFRHNNTTPATFALAAELVRCGARPTELYEYLFEQSTLARLRLTGLILERMQVVEDGKVAFTELRRGDYEATGAVPQDSEDLINYTRSVAGVEVGLFFMEQPRGGIKVSFRSRSRIDVGKLAERFSGGGHRLASGATLDTTLEEARARVLRAVADVLKSPPT